MKRKKTVCILFGGQSSEHEVSRMSATSIIKNIDRNKYDIITVGITKDGRWLLYTGEADKITTGQWETMNEGTAVLSPDAQIHGIININNNKVKHIKVDAVFPVLHGLYGEDGTVQGVCELAKIPYVGPDVLSSALCMDKAYTNIVFKEAGIPHAKYITIYSRGYTKKLYEIINEIEKEFEYPCFIKPSKAGSSVGLTKAHDRNELIEGLKIAAKEDSKILIEENIEGKEIECSVLGNYEPKASVVGEIEPAREFYDYEAKYNDNNSKLYIPANIPEAISDQVREYAVKAYKMLGCKGMSRIDFFIQAKTNKVYINEINTIPGFTNISMYPKLWEATGLNYPDLIDKLIQLAIEY